MNNNPKDAIVDVDKLIKSHVQSFQNSLLKKKEEKVPDSFKEFMCVINEYAKENEKLPFDERNLYPPAIDSQIVINCLCDCFLGGSYYISDPLPNCQANTIICYDILMRYSPIFRKYVKEMNKKK